MLDKTIYPTYILNEEGDAVIQKNKDVKTFDKVVIVETEDPTENITTWTIEDFISHKRESR